jgi:putative redox protein
LRSQGRATALFSALTRCFKAPSRKVLTPPITQDLYDAALGACEALTALWYANRKGIPVDDIEITVERDQSEEKTGVYRLESKLKLGGNLSDAQRAELLAVASQCPVYKLMTSVQTVIETTLVE